jgi:hypothetical protein
LSWQRLDAKRSCRLAYTVTLGGWKSDESNWALRGIVWVISWP